MEVLSALPLEEYLHTSYKPDVHFINGVLEERNMGEYEHNKVQTLIAVLFTLYAKNGVPTPLSNSESS